MLIWALLFSYTSLYFSCKMHEKHTIKNKNAFHILACYAVLSTASLTHIAGDILDPLHVLLVWSVIRQSVSLSLGLVVLHLVDNLRNNHHSQEQFKRYQIIEHFFFFTKQKLTSVIFLLRLWASYSGVSRTEVNLSLARSYCSLYLH